MDSSDLMKFGSKFAELCEAFNEQPTQLKTELYYSRLEEFPIDQVVKAIDSAIDNGRFFPKVAELREAIKGSVSDRANMAWQCLQKALDEGGYYNSLHVDDPALAFAIQRTFGTWMDIANQLPPIGDPMHASLRKQFCQNYEIYGKYPVEVQQYFPGFYEAQNRQNAGTWGRANDFKQQVVIIAGNAVFTRELIFDGRTGALTGESRQQLSAGLKPLPPKPVRPALPPLPDSTADMTDEDVAAVKAHIRALIAKPKYE